MKKKTIGIITYCNYGKLNYGQIYQAYAMQCVLKRLGMSPRTFRYIGNSTEQTIQWRFHNRFLSEAVYVLNSLIGYREYAIFKRRMRFERWLYRNLAFSVPCYTLSDLERASENLDYLLCGSDQIWNPAAFDPAYYLKFGSPDIPRISYAASMGGWSTESIVPMSIQSTLKKAGVLIDRFTAVSVREADSVPLLEQYTQKKVGHVLDPTLLVPARIWRSVSVPVSGLSEKERFLFVYMLGKPSDWDIHNMKQVMKTRNIKKLIYVPTLIEEYAIDFGTAIWQAGPGEFLWLLSNADFVYTDSFHGTAFSVIFQRQFLTVKRNSSLRGRNAQSVAAPNRARNLLCQLHMENQFVEGEIKELQKDIDYKAVAGYLKEARQASYEFLRAALDNGEKSELPES